MLQLAKSSKSKNGYLNVVEPHTGQFYPKKKLDGESGSKKMKTFGTKCGTAREAAIKLAEYLYEPYPLPVAGPRAAYGSKNMEKYLIEKKERRVQVLQREARMLLGIDPDEPVPQFVSDPADPHAPPIVCVEAEEVEDLWSSPVQMDGVEHVDT